jgi:hypothetical protein
VIAFVCELFAAAAPVLLFACSSSFVGIIHMIDCVETDVGIVFLVIVATWAYMTLFHSLAQIASSDTRYAHVRKGFRCVGFAFLNLFFVFFCFCLVSMIESI